MKLPDSTPDLPLAERGHGPIDAEIEGLERRVAESPGDVDAWIRWITLAWRRSGWMEARRIMHRGWMQLRGGEPGESRYRLLMLSAFDLLGDPDLARTSPLRDFSVSADGSRLFLGGADCCGLLLERTSGRQLAVCEGFAAGIHLARIDARAELALTVGHDGTALLWSLPAHPLPDRPEPARAERLWNQRVLKVPEALLDASSLSRHPLHSRGDLAADGRHAVLGTKIFSLEAPGRLPRLAAELEADRVCLGFLGSGEVLASTRGPTLSFHDAESGQVFQELELPGKGRMELSWISRDGSRAIRVDRSGPGVEVLRTEMTGTEASGDGRPPRTLRRLLERIGWSSRSSVPAGDRRILPGTHITAGSLSDDGRVLAVGLHPPRVLVMETDGLRTLAELGDLEETVRALRIMPGEPRVAVAQRRHLRLLAWG